MNETITDPSSADETAAEQAHEGTDAPAAEAAQTAAPAETAGSGEAADLFLRALSAQDGLERAGNITALAEPDVDKLNVELAFPCVWVSPWSRKFSRNTAMFRCSSCAAVARM